MKKISLLLIFAAVTFALSAVSCKAVVDKAITNNNGVEASENFVSKTLDVTTVDKIDVSHVIDVIYVQDETVSVEFVVPDNLIEMYRYSAKGGTLKVWKNNNDNVRFKKTNHPKLIIHSPGVKEVELSGASSFTARSMAMADGATEFDISGASSVAISDIQCGKLSIELSGASSMKVASTKVKNIAVDCSGASNLTMAVDCDILNADCSGASTTELAGSAKTVIYDCSGASKINAGELVAESGKIEVSGASKLNYNIRELLAKDVSGMSKASNKAN